MRIARVLTCAVAVFCLALAPAYAQKGKGGGAAAPHGNPHTTTAAKAPTPATHGPSASTQGPKTTTHGPTTHGGSKSTTATTTTTKTHGNPHTTAKPSGTSTAGTTTATTTTSATTGTPTSTGTTATTTTTTLNPIAQKLQGKPLGGRIEKMLPANMTLNTASAGFRNQGQFIAAVHVSQNLGIPFADLRAAMLGLPRPGTHSTPNTTLTPLSLGQAIKQLRPLANAPTEASHAETQAPADLSTTTTTGTTTATSGTTATKSSKKKSD